MARVALMALPREGYWTRDPNLGGAEGTEYGFLLLPHLPRLLKELVLLLSLLVGLRHEIVKHRLPGMVDPNLSKWTV